MIMKKSIADYFVEALNRLFSSESSMLTDEFVEIMNDENDREKYLDAINEAKEKKHIVEKRISSDRTLIVTP